MAQRTLFVTGGAVNPGVAEFLAQNAGRVIEKPCGAGTLRDAVAAVLAGP